MLIYLDNTNTTTGIFPSLFTRLKNTYNTFAVGRIKASIFIKAKVILLYTIIRNGEIYSPDYLGKQDILLVFDRILKISPNVNLPAGIGEVIEIDASGKYVVPGFIDQHVHLTGGGGEGGPVTRTPEIMLSDLTLAGITTVVGLLGVDGITRSMNELLAKARALEYEGITTYIFSGAYEIPTRTITGNVRADLVLIDKVIGVGEIAISDHRSAQPTAEMLIKLASEARVGGMLGNKAGVLLLHVGEGKQGLDLIFEVLNRSDLPVTQFVPTHVNRLESLFQEALTFVRSGGVIDLTSGITRENDSSQSLEVKDALSIAAKENINFDMITVSSDSNGSIPSFDSLGNLAAIDIGSASRLWDDIRKAILEEIITLPVAVSLITRNAARVLKLLPRKGIVTVGSDADLVILNGDDYKIDTVIAKGKIMVSEGKPKIKGYFEKGAK